MRALSGWARNSSARRKNIAHVANVAHLTQTLAADLCFTTRMTASATIVFSHAPRGLASPRGDGLGTRKRCPGLAPLGVAFRFLGSPAFHPEFTRKNFGKRIATIFSRQPMMEFHALFRCNQASPAKFLWILGVNSKSKENVERSRAFILRSNNRNPNLTLRCRFFVTLFQSLERLVNN